MGQLITVLEAWEIGNAIPETSLSNPCMERSGATLGRWYNVGLILPLFTSLHLGKRSIASRPSRLHPPDQNRTRCEGRCITIPCGRRIFRVKGKRLNIKSPHEGGHGPEIDCRAIRQEQTRDRDDQLIDLLPPCPFSMLRQIFDANLREKLPLSPHTFAPQASQSCGPKKNQ